MAVHNGRLAAIVLLVASILSVHPGCRFHAARTEYRYLSLDPPDATAARVIELQDAVLALLASEDYSGLQALLHSDIREGADPADIRARLAMIRQQSGAIRKAVPVEAMEVEFTEASPRDPSGLFRYPPLPSERLRTKVLPSSPTLGKVVIVLSKAQSELGDRPVWLSIVAKPDGDAMHLTGFHFTFERSGGHGPEWFAKKASEFETAGQLLNAYLFREAAIRLVPSPFLTPSYFQDLRREQPSAAPEGVPRPGLRPAETWTLPTGESLEIDYVAPVMATGFFALEVRYMSDDDDPTSARAASTRRGVFHYLQSRFPEYEEAFEGVFVGTETKSGSGYRDYFQFEAPGDRRRPTDD